MHFLLLLSVGALVSLASLAAPASSLAIHYEGVHKRDNLCNLKTPPVLCQPNSSVTVDETALRAYKFYRAFVVDGAENYVFIARFDLQGKL
jgi:hypothetical protein